MWNFGCYKIESKVVLAPMAGYTSLGYREFMKEFGVGLFYTEMVSDMGLIYDNEETNRYITFDNNCFPTGVQLFGHDPLTIAKAATIASAKNKNIAFFDINMGCPVPKVTKVGSGSALMKNPKLCGDIIRELKKVTNLPISAKIRLGWDDSSINYLEVIKELEDAGVDMIAIHARTRKELYSGTPHFNLLKGLRNKMNVPLVISGNIYTLEDAIKAIDITGADAVMVARGGVGNPYLLKQIDEYYKTGTKLLNPSLDEQLKWCYELGGSLVNELGENRAMRVYRAMAPKFINDIKNAKEYKALLAGSLTTLDSLKIILRRIKDENGIY